jgi:hypothetical protein
MQILNNGSYLNSAWNATNTSYVPYTGANQNVNLGNNNFSVNGTTFFVDTNNSRVGIGTTSPAQSLDIAGGNAVFDSGYGIYSNGDSGAVVGTLMLTGSATGTILRSADGDAADGIHFQSYDGVDRMFMGSGSNYMGRLGIGTTSPLQNLHVNGSAIINGTLNMDANKIINLSNGTALTDAVTLAQLQAVNATAGAGEPLWTANYTAFNASWNNMTNVSYMTGANFTLQNTSMKNYVISANTTLMQIMNNGSYLNSAWNATNTSYVPYTGANQNVNLGNNNLTVNGTTLFVDTNNSRVGIGTTAPADTLEVKTAGQGSIRFGGSDGRTLSAYDSGGSNDNFNFAHGAFFDGNLYGSNFGDGGTNKQWLKLNGTTASLWTNNLERVTVLNNGNVGIGTTNPFQALHVNGSILANGTINATTDVCIQGGSNICLSNVSAAGGANWNNNYSTFLTHITWANVNNGTIWSWIINATSEPKWNANFTAFNTSWTNTYNSTTNTTLTNAINAAVLEPKWTANYTAFNASWSNTTNTSYLEKAGGTMTGNLNLSANVNLTMNGGNQIGSNITCVQIKGSTSILEVC